MDIEKHEFNSAWQSVFNHSLIELRLVALTVLLLTSVYGFSQITIPRTDRSPDIDGRVDDVCWESGALIDKFLQREPDQGMPLTERTEVFILYDSNNIYFGIKCFQDPRTISAKEMQRGAPLKYDDRVHIILDTYLNGRNAYFFEINPLGSIGDGLVSENGRQMNISWDGLFEGKSSITEQGWEAELAIPFKTISFDPQKSSWGLFINRLMESKQEWGSWPVANINMPQAAVSDAGVITGMQGITQGVGLDITPYALTGFDARNGEETKYRLNAGVDLYYQLTPNLKASLSANTDFAEIEADARQINLSRFSIRLDEKRNFFLDGADLFSFGLEGRRTEPPSGKLSPFFSRRMGINAEGLAIPINFAGKLSGRINKWNIGLIHINEKRATRSSNSLVFRISRNIGQLSSIGVITTYGNAINESQNLVAGVDLNLATNTFRGNKNLGLMLFGLKSTTALLKGNDAAWGALLTYPNDLVNFKLGHQQIGHHFLAGLGFVPRTNIKEYWGDLSVAPRINRLGIRQYSAGGGFNVVAGFDNALQSRSFTVKPVEIRFNSGDIFSFTMANRYENLIEDFNIYTTNTIPAAVYSWWENQFSLVTAGSRDVYGSINFTQGDFYTGRKNSLNASLNWKVFIHAFVGGSFSRDNVRLRDSEFTADIFQFNINLLFSPNLTLYNYLQYDSQSKTTGLQMRFKWILKPGNEMLLVWNSGYSESEKHFLMSENSMRFKLKYNLRL